MVRLLVPPQTLLIPLATVSPAGSVSVKATPVRATELAAGFVIVNCNNVVAFKAIGEGLNNLAIDGGATLLRLKVACGAGPAATSTVYAPALPFAVNVPGSAMPLPSVVIVLVPVLLKVNVPLWPLPPVCAVNTTDE